MTLARTEINAENLVNRHCCVVEVDGSGVLIEGRSGSGKSSLALGLVDMARARGLEAALIADDRALLRRVDGDLVASAPEAIAGLAEIRGLGVVRVPHRDSTKIRVVARLVADELVERLPEAERVAVLGADLPLLRLPERHENQGVRIVLGWLEMSRGPLI